MNHKNIQVRETTPQTLIQQIRNKSRPLEERQDLDPLLEQIGDARYVLLGEASHGTADYYLWRIRLTQRLIQEKGFSFMAVEGDWPDCYKVNRYIKGYAEAGENALEVLKEFDRWPTWMWANWEIVALAEWLRHYNQENEAQVGFYGLDVYSLWESLRAILDYLEESAPDAVEAAKRAFRCFEPYSEDVQAYALSTVMVPKNCEQEVVDLLSELRRQTRRFPDDSEAAFNAEQNALVTVNAEQYYREMIRGGAASWNLRDHHMVDTLNNLMEHHGEGAKCIVWAHNTHVGDARATDMAQVGMVNIGQLVREEQAAGDVRLIGFGSHRGSVIAGDAWDAPLERMSVPEAREGSWESRLHEASAYNKLLLLDEAEAVAEFLDWRGHRAIGVVYHPERERHGNYVPTILPRRYDAFLYLDETHALHPLHIETDASGKPPETYPWGL